MAKKGEGKVMFAEVNDLLQSILSNAKEIDFLIGDREVEAYLLTNNVWYLKEVINELKGVDDDMNDIRDILEGKEL